MPGEAEISLPYRDDLTQQHGFVHAGIIATIADTACGYAAFSLMPADMAVLTVEYKINLMAPAVGELFHCPGPGHQAGEDAQRLHGRGHGAPSGRRAKNGGHHAGDHDGSSPICQSGSASAMPGSCPRDGRLTVEYKINLMAPAVGELFMARGRVIRPGKTLSVCTAEVMAHHQGKAKTVATMLATMMALPNQEGLTG